MHQKDRDTYRLSTGREFYANRGIIGIANDGTITEGYDGHVMPDPDDLGYKRKAWTVQERVELAEYMIERWQAWQNQQ